MGKSRRRWFKDKPYPEALTTTLDEAVAVYREKAPSRFAVIKADAGIDVVVPKGRLSRDENEWLSCGTFRGWPVRYRR